MTTELVVIGMLQTEGPEALFSSSLCLSKSLGAMLSSMSAPGGAVRMMPVTAAIKMSSPAGMNSVNPASVKAIKGAAPKTACMVALGM